MGQRSFVNWRIVTAGIVLSLVASAPQPGVAQGMRGQARAVQTTVSTLFGSQSVSLADTGTLNDATDAREASQNVGSVSGVFNGEALHATAVGLSDRVASEASVAGVALSVGGIAIGADFVMSRALAGSGAPSASSTIEDLSIAGVPIPVTGEPNQTVTFPGGRVILNEQRTSAGSVTVNALHVIVDGVVDVVVASATAGTY